MPQHSDRPALPVDLAGLLDDPPQRISDLLATLRTRKLSCRAACEALIPGLAANPADPLLAPLRAVADAADASGIANRFHNPDHSRNVGVVWITLASLNNRMAAAGETTRVLSPRELLLGACAAFGHDIGHDGLGNEVEQPGSAGGNGRARLPFRLELIAADRVAAILDQHGVPPPDIRIVRAAILATDVADGYAALETALGLRAPPASRAWPADLEALGEPAARLIAAILRDADILPSAGLTATDHDRHTIMLERELGLEPGQLGPDGAEQFFGAMLGGRFLSPPGRLFQSQMDKLRALNDRRRADKRLHGRTLSDLARAS